jgi:hypothetical protein
MTLEQIYNPLQNLRLVRFESTGQVFLISNIEVVVKVNQSVVIDTKNIGQEPDYQLRLDVVNKDIPGDWTYPWQGELKTEVHYSDPQTWTVHAVVYDTNGNKKGEVTNSIKSSQVIDV